MQLALAVVAIVALVFIQTGTIIEHGHTVRDNKQPHKAADTKSDAEKLEDIAGGEGDSHAEPVAETETKVDLEGGPLAESVKDKPTEAEPACKTEPTEEVEVEVEEFYVKYKNL